jgi:ribonuclease VapC
MAIALREPEEEEFLRIMHDDGQVLVSAAALVELYIVALGQGEDVYERAQSLLHDLPITVVPFDAEQAELADDANHRYGKGRRHPAQLNFGDTFSYALAKAQGLPLLFKGDDFTRTDVAVVL